jgi:hypothetical protein
MTQQLADAKALLTYFEKVQTRGWTASIDGDSLDLAIAALRHMVEPAVTEWMVKEALAAARSPIYESSISFTAMLAALAAALTAQEPRT